MTQYCRLVKYIQTSFNPRNYPPEVCIAMVTISINTGMPQTCPYNFSYKQAIKLLQKPVTQEVTQV